MSKKIKKAMILDEKGKFNVVEYDTDSYSFLSKSVDGYIERLPITMPINGIDAWANEEAKFREDLKPSAFLGDGKHIYDFVKGNIVFTRHRGANTVSLTDKDIEMLSDYLNIGVEHVLSTDTGKWLPLFLY